MLRGEQVCALLSFNRHPKRTGLFGTWARDTGSYLVGDLRTESLPIVRCAEDLIEFESAEHDHQEVVWIHHGDTCLFFCLFEGKEKRKVRRDTHFTEMFSPYKRRHTCLARP